MLALFSRPDRDHGRSDDLTGVAPLGELTAQDVSGPTGLVARAELAALGPPIEEAPELAWVVGELLHKGGLLAYPLEDRQSDRILVDVHTDEDQ